MADKWGCETRVDVDHREFVQTADRSEQCANRNVIDLNLQDPVVVGISQIKGSLPGGSENRIIQSGNGETRARIKQRQEADRLLTVPVGAGRWSG